MIINQWLTSDSDIRHYRVVKGYRLDYSAFMLLSRPGRIIAVYPPDKDALVQSLAKSLWMHECPV